MGITARKAVRAVNGFFDMAVLTAILLSVAFAGYALWDSRQIHRTADKSNYAVYKPTAENEGKSFQELQALNGDVFAWLNVYGTNIDYPVAQGRDNMKYVNTNAEGLYSLSGAIFLDCGNSRDFTDFNSILYGHHMEKKAMFGEIGLFAEKLMFESHRYASLYFGGKEHGVVFFAFVHTSAYDSAVYAPNAAEGARQAYLDGLLAKAAHKRDVGVTARDRILLLSTCSSGSTNGRDILVGKITDDTYENPFPASGGKRAQPNRFVADAARPLWALAALPALPVLVFIARRKREKERKNGVGIHERNT